MVPVQVRDEQAAATEKAKVVMSHACGPTTAVLPGVRRLTHEDVGGLEVSVQDGRLAGVEVQHCPGDGPHPAGQLEGVQLALSRAMQQQVQGAFGAVLGHQNEVVLPPADAPQSHHIVMRACKQSDVAFSGDLI